MEEKLIVTVCGYKKELAWRRVSEETGLSEEVCRRRWKGLRDAYVRERRKDAGRKSGSAAGTGKRWKSSAVLSFLDSFVTSRETSGIMGQGVEEERNAEYTEDNDEEQVGEDQESDAAAAAERDIPDQFSDASEAGPSAAASTPVRRVRALKRSRRTENDRESQLQLLLLEHLKRQQTEPAPLPPSEDEMFLKSLIALLSRLSPQQPIQLAPNLKQLS